LFGTWRNLSFDLWFASIRPVGCFLTRPASAHGACRGDHGPHELPSAIIGSGPGRPRPSGGAPYEERRGRSRFDPPPGSAGGGGFRVHLGLLSPGGHLPPGAEKAPGAPAAGAAQPP